MKMLAAFHKKYRIEAGVDEAGRGCLAGPVVAAAVILPGSFRNEELNDSKMLLPQVRDKLRLIIEKEAIAFGIGIVDNHTIDEINILRASHRAMHLAIHDLKSKPEFLLIDGDRFEPYPGISHACCIKGDGTYLSIAAASVLAKTYRDELMVRLHEEFPHYDWHNNKGYATLSHRKAILEFGTTSYHRLSFNLLGQPELF